MREILKLSVPSPPDGTLPDVEEEEQNTNWSVVLVTAIASSLIASILQSRYIPVNEMGALLLKTRRAIPFFMTCFILTLFVFLWRARKSRRRLVASVKVYPTGYQIQNERDGKVVGFPIFIPREEILDVVVNEHIRSHKVETVVLFRVLKRDRNTTNRKQSRRLEEEDQTEPLPISTLFIRDEIVLVPAFRGVEISYRECHRLFDILSRTLRNDKVEKIA